MKASGLEEAFINVHWCIPRPVNGLFTGRTEVLEKIRNTLCQSRKSTNREQQSRFVITGLGGQGKSEICLKVADLMREAYVISTYWH